MAFFVNRFQYNRSNKKPVERGGKGEEGIEVSSDSPGEESRMGSLTDPKVFQSSITLLRGIKNGKFPKIFLRIPIMKALTGSAWKKP